MGARGEGEREGGDGERGAGEGGAVVLLMVGARERAVRRDAPCTGMAMPEPEKREAPKDLPSCQRLIARARARSGARDATSA